jgi:glycine/D-amino acid oxidase-like deaminating enzyme
MPRASRTWNPALPNSYWAATAVKAADLPRLDGHHRADICVVGGGFLGLSAALHLAEHGAAVTLLEAAEPGWGASGRNGGQIIAGFKVERSELVQRLGEEQGNRLFDWSGGFPDFVMDLVRKHGIDCDARQSGWLQPAHSTQILRSYETRTQEWQQRGVAVALFDRQKAAEVLGTSWYKGAYYDPRGGRLQPLSYARGLAKAALKAGARLFANAPVTSVQRLSDGFLVRTAAGEVHAGRVLVCTNAYSDAFADWPFRKLAGSVIPVLSYMIATRPLSDNLRRSILPGGETAADLKRLTNHFRIESDGRLLFGGRGGMKESNRPSDFAPLLKKLHECFPQLGEVGIDYAWGGKVALTLDHLPHLHELAPGLFAALGCNGRGVGMASAIGKAVADGLVRESFEDCPIPTTEVPAIPFHGLRVPVLQAAVAWKDYLDRSEQRRP